MKQGDGMMKAEERCKRKEKEGTGERICMCEDIEKKRL